MAPFIKHPSTYSRIDWDLLHNGPINLYWRLPYVEADTSWLLAHGYQVDSFDASSWDTEEEMHLDLKTKLEFPDYYGGNLNALNDCLRDLEISDDGGRAIAILHFDHFASRMPEVAWNVLDILADQSRNALLFGRRLLAIVQSDDVRFSLRPVGATSVHWNPKEWLNSDRGL